MSLNSDLKASLLSPLDCTVKEMGATLVYVTHDVGEARWFGAVTRAMAEVRITEVSVVPAKGDPSG